MEKSKIQDYYRDYYTNNRIKDYYSSGKTIKQIQFSVKGKSLRDVYDILFPDLYNHIAEENLPVVDMYLEGKSTLDIAYELQRPHFEVYMITRKYFLRKETETDKKYFRILDLHNAGVSVDRIAEIVGYTTPNTKEVKYVLKNKEFLEDVRKSISMIKGIYAIANDSSSTTPEKTEEHKEITPEKPEKHKENTEEIDARTFPLFKKGWGVIRVTNKLPYDKLTVMRSKYRYNKLNSVQPSKPSTLNDSIEPGAAKEAIKEHFQLPVKLSSQLPEQDDRYFDMYPPEEQEDVSHR